MQVGPVTRSLNIATNIAARNIPAVMRVLETPSPMVRRLSTSVARTPLALELHLDAWEDLIANAAEPNPFFEPHALLHAWQELALTEVQVVLVWAPTPAGKSPALAGLFPIVRSARTAQLPLPAFEIWTHRYASNATPLVRAELAGEAIEALFGWLRSETDAALFAWRTVSADGPFRHALTDTLNRLGFESFREHSHTRALFRPAANAEAYLSRAISGKKRKDLRRMERRLSELGELRYAELGPDGDLDAWLDELIALEDRCWHGQGALPLARDPQALALFRALAHGAFARGRWMAFALRLTDAAGDRAIAMKCNLRAGPGGVAYKAVSDEAFARYAPGALLELEHIGRLHSGDAPSWLDAGTAAGHPLWCDRLTIETLIVPTGRRPGALAVAAMPLARWMARVLHDTAKRVRRLAGGRSANSSATHNSRSD